MADPVVRDTRVDDGDDRGAADTSEPVDEVLVEEEKRSERGSLYEPHGTASDEANPYGRLGRPISRHAPFYRGFVGALGVLVALVFGLRRSAAVVGHRAGTHRRIPRGGAEPDRRVRDPARHEARLGGAGRLDRRCSAFLTGLLYVVGGVLRNQVVTLVNDAPKLIADLRHHKTIAHLDAKYHVLSGLENKLRRPDFLTDAFGGVFNVGLTVLNAVVTTVVVLILTLYFLASLPTLKRALYSLAPSTRRERVAGLGDEILRRVGRYVIGAVSVALLAGTVSLLFLLSVGLDAVRTAAGRDGGDPRPGAAGRIDHRRCARHASSGSRTRCRSASRASSST